MSIEPSTSFIIPQEFTSMHLLRLVEAVENIGNRSFTEAVANALHLIHHPPMVFRDNKS